MLQRSGIGYDISSAALFIKALPSGSPISPKLEKMIVEKYNSGTADEKIDMGLLSHWYVKHSGAYPSAEHSEFFNRMKQDKSLEVPYIESANADELLDANKRNFQMHVFYNDADGAATFESFSKALENDGWRSMRKSDFLIFSKEQNGRSIKLLVSPPEQDGAAIQDIQEYVRDQGGKISVLMHRGHSYHVDTTLRAVMPENKIVFLGSCGGYSNVSSVLGQSPEANILSTAATGRMAINNATILWINQQILSGQDVRWDRLNTVWDKLRRDKDLAGDIDSYVSPNKNLMLMFEMKRRELYKQADAEEYEPREMIPQRQNPATAPISAVAP